MKKIHKLVLKSFLGPLVVTFTISMLVLLMHFLWIYVDDLVGKGLNTFIVIKLLFYASLTLVPMALPITVLLASLMTLGNMGERYELVALKSAGISLQKLMHPLIVLTIGISGVSFLFSNNVYPYAFLKYRTLLYDIQMKKPALNIKEGEYYKRIDGYVIRFQKKESDGKTIHDVQIYDHTDKQGNNRLTMSKSGLMQTTADGKFLLFTLYDGYSYTEDHKDFQTRNKHPFSRVKFEEQSIRIDLSSFAMGQSDETLFANHEKIQNLPQLQNTIDTLEMQYHVRTNEILRSVLTHYSYYNLFFNDTVKSNKSTSDIQADLKTPECVKSASEQISTTLAEVKYYARDLQAREAIMNGYETEWHRKFTYAVACLLLFLVGVPLGAIIRRGGLGMPVVVSVLIFIAYFVLSKIGETSVLTTDLSVWRGMWMSSVVFLPIGLFLLVKATFDAAFLDADVWRRKFLTLLGRK